MKVETKELLSIGRFARLTGLTVKALRHYDVQGLLSPAHVDDWTGYRYYTADQAGEAIVSAVSASWSCRWTRSAPCSTPIRTRFGNGWQFTAPGSRAAPSRCSSSSELSTASSRERSLSCNRRRSSHGSRRCPR